MEFSLNKNFTVVWTVLFLRFVRFVAFVQQRSGGGGKTTVLQTIRTR